MDTSSFHTNTKNLIILPVLVLGLLYVAGQYVGSLPERERQDQEERLEITVQGTGKVAVIPDIATIQLGVQIEPRPTAEDATTALTEKMNAVIAFVREQGIEDKDISTAQLSVTPSYDFNQSGRVLRGYEAQQTLTVKVRQVDTVGTLVSGSAGLGANQIGSVQFTTDDPRQLNVKAQQEAITDARTQAQALADSLDAKLGRITRFETGSQPTQPPILFERGLTASDATQKLEVPSGESEINATVTITYELR